MQSPGPTPELGVGGGCSGICVFSQPASSCTAALEGVEPPILQQALGKGKKDLFHCFLMSLKQQREKRGERHQLIFQ